MNKYQSWGQRELIAEIERLENTKGIDIKEIVTRNADDVCVSVARAFERLEERIDAMESRIYTRFADIEDKIEKLTGIQN